MNKGIDVEIIKDSTNWTGKRLTTFVLKYPRYIHSELMTHRVFSKNSASSRAIPIERMIKNIQEDTVEPIWTINKSGMSGEYLTDEKKVIEANDMWKGILEAMTEVFVPDFIRQGIHKQNVNRLLEPWMHIKIILTGTDFSNWYELRNHPDAQPEIQELARKMLKAQEESVPQYLEPGQWHIPFGDKVPNILEEQRNIFYNRSLDEIRLQVSVARCARISYNNVDGTDSSVGKDLELFEKLIVSKPLHASPAEHQAQVPYPKDYIDGHMDVRHGISVDEEQLLEGVCKNHIVMGWYPSSYKLIEEHTKNMLELTIKENKNRVSLKTFRGKYVSNLQGWIQYRKLLEEQFKNNKN